jgi:hypothetical protein
MVRLLSLSIITLALALPACSTQEPEPEPPQLLVEAPAPIPPPPTFVDVLPEFKKQARAFLDLAKKVHELAAKTPLPSYQEYWKEYLVVEEVYAKVINNEPKYGPGADTFARINKIRDSLFKTRQLLKNTEELKVRQLSQALEQETSKRLPSFEEAEFFWRQTPEKTDEKEILKLQLQG